MYDPIFNVLIPVPRSSLISPLVLMLGGGVLLLLFLLTSPGKRTYHQTLTSHSAFKCFPISDQDRIR